MQVSVAASCTRRSVAREDWNGRLLGRTNWVPSTIPSNVEPGKPARILKEVTYTETSPGDFEISDAAYPVNRANAVSNGFNNSKLCAKALQQEIQITTKILWKRSRPGRVRRA